MQGGGVGLGMEGNTDVRGVVGVVLTAVVITKSAVIMAVIIVVVTPHVTVVLAHPVAAARQSRTSPRRPASRLGALTVARGWRQRT